MLRTSRPLGCSRNPLAGGGRLGGRCFSLDPIGSRTNACLQSSGSRIVLAPDRVEALLGDAKGHGPGFSVAPPAQQRATGADLFQQPGADELVDGLAKRFARYVCRQVNSAIVTPRSRGQNDVLRIGES